MMQSPNWRPPSGALVVASVSGGKDSAALSLWLTEQGIEHERVFADTGWEAPKTYDYLRGPLPAAIGEIRWLQGPLDMVGLIRKKAMFPSRLRRFCTEDLKVRPIFSYLFEQIADGRDVVNAVGIRAAESRSRATMLEVDGYRDKRGSFTVWRPLIGWSEQDVIDIHKRHNLAPNPLYLKGATRVGCWPCIYARKAEIRLVADHDPDRIALIEDLEAETTRAADTRTVMKTGVPNPNPRTWFAGRGPAALGGRAGAMRIGDAVRWSRTKRGGREEDTEGPDPYAGCVRWGLCEHPDAESEVRHA